WHWVDGGPTSLANAAMLCGYHHTLIHQGDWAIRIAADGHPEIIPPTWIDPDQHPRRNHLHRLRL
ncbi:MAG TPA: HNH endonuclease, partial [Nakamurella sp.]